MATNKNPILYESLKDVIFTIFDTETTGDNSKGTDKPIEIAAVHWNLEKGFLHMPKSWLVDPQMSIHPAAIAVHGLEDKDVEGQPLLEQILPELHSYIENTILVAHNIEFDLNMLPSLREKDNITVDSLRLVRQVFEIGEIGIKNHDLRSHKMQELRYWLALDVDTMGLQAHRAAADILVTGEVFGVALKRFLDRSYSTTVEDLVDFVQAPMLKEKMMFGKFKGMDVKEAVSLEAKNPKNYFVWLLRQVHKGEMQLDPDMRYTIEYYMKQNDIDPIGILIEDKEKDWKNIASKTAKRRI